MGGGGGNGARSTGKMGRIELHRIADLILRTSGEQGNPVTTLCSWCSLFFLGGGALGRNYSHVRFPTPLQSADIAACRILNRGSPYPPSHPTSRRALGPPRTARQSDDGPLKMSQNGNNGKCKDMQGTGSRHDRKAKENVRDTKGN